MRMNRRADTNRRENNCSYDYLMNYRMNDVIFRNGVPPPVFHCPHCKRPIVNHPSIHRRGQDVPRMIPPPHLQAAGLPFSGVGTPNHDQGHQNLHPLLPTPSMYGPQTPVQRAIHGQKPGQADANGWWYYANRVPAQELPLAMEASPPRTTDLLHRMTYEEGSNAEASEARKIPEVDLDLRL